MTLPRLCIVVFLSILPTLGWGQSAVEYPLAASLTIESTVCTDCRSIGISSVGDKMVLYAGQTSVGPWVAAVDKFGEPIADLTPQNIPNSHQLSSAYIRPTGRYFLLGICKVSGCEADVPAVVDFAAPGQAWWRGDIETENVVTAAWSGGTVTDADIWFSDIRPDRDRDLLPTLTSESGLIVAESIFLPLFSADNRPVNDHQTVLVDITTGEYVQTLPGSIKQMSSDGAYLIGECDREDAFCGVTGELDLRLFVYDVQSNAMTFWPTLVRPSVTGNVSGRSIYPEQILSTRFSEQTVILHNTFTRELVVWLADTGRTVVIAKDEQLVRGVYDGFVTRNSRTQQCFLRTLDGLARKLGKSCYDAAQVGDRLGVIYDRQNAAAASGYDPEDYLVLGLGVQYKELVLYPGSTSDQIPLSDLEQQLFLDLRLECRSKRLEKRVALPTKTWTKTCSTYAAKHLRLNQAQAASFLESHYMINPQEPSQIFAPAEVAYLAERESCVARRSARKEAGDIRVYKTSCTIRSVNRTRGIGKRTHGHWRQRSNVVSGVPITMLLGFDKSPQPLINMISVVENYPEQSYGKSNGNGQ